MTDQPTPEAVEIVADALADSLMPNAEYLLAFIRDAIHRDGDDADAIRETLGLRWKFAGSDPKPRWRQVVGEWQEVQP